MAACLAIVDAIARSVFMCVLMLGALFGFFPLQSICLR